MMPWGHFAVVYVPLALFTLLRGHRLPTGRLTLTVLIATQLPDLIDKPLAWTVAVIPSGRMLAHSLVVAGPALLVLLLICRHRGHTTLGVIFAGSYLSHLAVDFQSVLWLGSDYYFFPNMVWPLLPANPDRHPSFGAHFVGYTPSLTATVEIAILAVGCGVVLLDSYRNGIIVRIFS